MRRPFADAKQAGRAVFSTFSAVERNVLRFSVLHEPASVFAADGVFYRRTCQRNTYDLLARILYYILYILMCVHARVCVCVCLPSLAHAHASQRTGNHSQRKNGAAAV